MSFRFTLRLGVAASIALAAPTFAQTAVDAEGRVFGNTITDPLPARLPPMPAGPDAAPSFDNVQSSAWEAAKADWLSECRRRYGGRSGLAGGVVGGVVGGVAGSAIAGRGNRTVGAFLGGVAGAAAGAAIGSNADRRRATDYCADYLDRYLAGYGQGGGYGAGFVPQMQPYGYAMQPMMVMVPVAMVAVPAAPVTPQRRCVETEVIEEWVPVTRPARRYIPRRAPAVLDKRVRIR